MTRPRLLFLDRLDEVLIDSMRRACEGRYDVCGVANSPPDESGPLETADVLLTMWGSVDSTTIDRARSATLIHKLGVGVDKIDLATARRRGITVLRASGVNADAVAELCVFLAIAVSRNALVAIRDYVDGSFPKEVIRPTSFQLAGKTAGLIGLGHVGRAVAIRFSALGMNVIYHDPYKDEQEMREIVPFAQSVDFEDCLRGSDVVSLHLPLTSQTRDLFDEEVISSMKDGAILINTARGGLVSEDALVAALRQEKLLGAGLDVTAVEPLPADSELRNFDRVVVTPHIGGAVGNNFQRVVAQVVANIDAFFGGGTLEPEDIVYLAGVR